MEALGNIRAYRTLLVEEAGIDMGGALAELETLILRADPLLTLNTVADATRPARSGTAEGASQANPLDGPTHASLSASAGTPSSAPCTGPSAGPALVPAELPADVSAFTGRGVELRHLDQLVVRAQRDRRMATIVIAGTAGVGKTALAVRFAHRARAHFPDGQIYLDLRANGPGEPMAPVAALTRLLAATGTPRQDTPLDADELTARFRTRVAGRRMLIVLDNASSVEQVSPLLPGTGPIAVLVTSRHALAGLVACHGAHRLDLDLLPSSESYSLLRLLIGENRVDADQKAALALISLCSRLPLALRVAAELAMSRPATPLAQINAELADQQHRQPTMQAGEDPRAAVAAAFSWSQQRLNEPSRPAQPVLVPAAT